MTRVTIRRRGSLLGIGVPAGTCIGLGFEGRQEPTLIELAEGVTLVERNPTLERQRVLAREVMREQSETLQELAKR